MANREKRGRRRSKDNVSGPSYEQCRDQRVKENVERMQKLGIFELSLKLKSSTPKRLPKNPSKKKTLIASGITSLDPPRRSARLESSTPVSYSELGSESDEETSQSKEIYIKEASKPEIYIKEGSKPEIYIKEGPKPEIYTEEDAKLLGDCVSGRDLQVDGYDEDGKRLYDPTEEKICHQCRSKTLGLHTHCCKCNLLRGNLCGDCLYTRYGENVTEVIMNPKWICPICRGICNCSSCRKSKGWMPTGKIYRKVRELGFKSVAHYLIQTRRAPQTKKTQLQKIQLM